MTADVVTGSAAIEIAASPETVFSFQTDPALVVRWMPGLVEAAPYGELVTGATTTAVYRIGGRVVHGTSRILDVHPPRLLVTEDVVKKRAMTQRVEIFETRAGNSRVEVEVRQSQFPFWYRMLARDRIGEILTLQLEWSLARLKSVIEDPGAPLPGPPRLKKKGARER